MSTNLKVDWYDRGFEPREKPNPNFPEGVDTDVTNGQTPTCQTTLPYPARRCGFYLVTCSLCGFNCLVTTAGRPDDPRSIRVPCKMRDAEAMAA